MPRDEAEAALVAVHENDVLAQAAEIQARRKPPNTNPVFGWDGPDGYVSAADNPLPVPVPTRPVFNPPLPIPAARAAEIAARLAQIERLAPSPALRQEAARLEAELGPPLPEYTADELAELLALVHDLKVWCNGCGRWHAVAVSLPRLRDLRQRWLDDRQAEADEAWRSHPAVKRRAAQEAAEAAEKQAALREERERQTARQRRADQLFGEMVGAGMTAAEAQALVRKQFADVF